MILLKSFLLCIFFFSVLSEGLIIPKLKPVKKIINPLYILKPNIHDQLPQKSPDQLPNKSLHPLIQKNKFSQIMNLIRVKNVIPTLFLCITGGWLVNPSFKNLLQSVPFIVSTINIILIMSASMVINDLYDIKMDKINNPERPLVSGAITKKEAIFIIIFLLGGIEYLSFKFLPIYLQTIMHLSIIYINLYTPVLKKILVLKNISCAILVSLSLFITALSAEYKPIILNKNFDLLIITCNFIFAGSWSNEILLDIRDYLGDNQQGISTLPTTFGKQTSWTCALLVLYIGLAMNTITLANLLNWKIAGIFLLLTLPQFYFLFNINKKDYSNKSIESYMKYSNITMILILIFIQLLAFYF